MPIVLNGTVGIDTPTLTGLTTPLTVAVGGTGAATLTSGSVLVGAGTSAVTGVAPSTSGNLLTSNGTAWTSAAPPSSTPTTAQVQTAMAGSAVGDLGTYAFLMTSASNTAIATGTNYAGSGLRYSGILSGTPASTGTGSSGQGSAPSGTWKAMGYSVANADFASNSVFLRVA
jgi:hypothetical protein